jgi:hypothetical protein
VIEEALLTEAVKNLIDQGIDLQKDILVLSSLFEHLVIAARLQRVGAMIDYSEIMRGDKEMLKLVEKYVRMSTSVDRRKLDTLKALRATRQEREKSQSSMTVTMSAFYSEMTSKAKELTQGDDTDIFPADITEAE